MAPGLKQALPLFVICTLGWLSEAFLLGSRPVSVNGHICKLESNRKATKLAAEGESFEQWEELNGGCKLLRPEHPKAVVHFLGGAFVSPQPTVAYRYVLEQLVALDYAVVATPFSVDFDYRKPAADIKEKFALAQQELVTNGYGSLPLFSMGHSLGALMHVLLACEFPEEYAEGISGAALISYNNKNVDGAIPAFKEFFVPALSPLEPLTRDQTIMDTISRVQKARASGFEAARDFANDVKDTLGLKEGESLIPGVRPLVLTALNDLEAAAQLVDQLPDVVASIARGASEFEPTPSEMKDIVSASYGISSPLLLKFSDDFIDESDALFDILPAQLGAKLEQLSGSHVTPLAIDPNAPSTPLLPIPDALSNDPIGLRNVLLADADALVHSLDDYFSNSISESSVSDANTGSSPIDDTPPQVNETIASDTSIDSSQSQENEKEDTRRINSGSTDDYLKSL